MTTKTDKLVEEAIKNLLVLFEAGRESVLKDCCQECQIRLRMGEKATNHDH